MAYSEGQLNGYADYRVGLDISLSSQNAGSNYSTFYWEVRFLNPTSYGSWSGSTQYWSASIGGQGYSGTFGIPFSERNTTSRVIASGYTNVSHNSDGTRPGFANSAYVDTDHENIGDGGSGDAWVDAPRFVRTPPAPAPLGIDQLADTSFRYRFNSTGDGGLAIEEWQIAYATNSGYTGALTVASGGTSTITGLTSGVQYWARSRGRNSQGWGAWSTDSTATTLLPAPTFSGWSQDSSGGLKATWSAPGTTTGMTGYRLVVARNDTFTDGVQTYDLGLISSYTVSGLVGGRTYYARVAARRADGAQMFSAARSTSLVLTAGNLDGWTRLGTKPANISYFTTEGIRRGTIGTKQALFLESLSTGAATLAADTFGIQRTVTTVVGRAYRFYASVTGTFASAPTSAQGTIYRLAVGSTLGATATLPSASGTVELPYIEFVATSTSTAIKILLGQSLTVPGSQDAVERAAINSIEFREVATDYPVRLRSTVYESNLANHLDLVANSAGATWYVDKAGITRLTLPGSALPVSATFSDTAELGALRYVDISVGYDTASTVNRIVATNYGVDPATGNALNSTLISENVESESLFGTYEEKIATNLYQEPPYNTALADRLNGIISLRKNPQQLITALRWNAQDNLPYAQSLEVGQRINVIFNGVTQNSQIVSINHDITPTRWIVSLNLQKL